jgi:O-antigen/teichoic acid export membrane protein
MKTVEKKGLRGRVLKAGAWVLSGHVAGQSIRLATNIVLARLLSPDAFGLMSVVYILMVGLSLFSDLGINRSVVQSPRGHEPELLDTAWTIQVIRGAGLGAMSLVIAAGFGIADKFDWLKADTVYADHRLPLVIAAFSLVALFAGLESIRIGLAKRQMQMRTLTAIDLSSQIAAAVAMLVVAYLFKSFWALVVGALLAGILRCIMGHVMLPGHQEHLRIDRSAARELLGHGKWIFLSSILGFAAVNGDRLLLGGLIDTHAFGLYAVAFLLVNVLQVVAATVCFNVAYPAFSEVYRERPKDLPRTIDHFQWAYDAIVVTIAAVFITGGPAIVSLLYDTRYQGAGWIMSVLAAGAIGLRYQVVEQCYQAVGRPEIATLSNFLRLIALAVGIWAGNFIAGFTGAVVGIALSQYATWPVAIWFKARYEVLTLRAELLLVPAIIVGACGGLVVEQGIGFLKSHHISLRKQHDERR